MSRNIVDFDRHIKKFPVTWTPEQVPTIGWWDSDDNGTVAHVSGAVSQWNDKSGNDNHAIQSTPSNRFTYTVDGQGRRCMSLGSNKYMDANGMCPLLGAFGNYEAYCIVRLDSFASFTFFFFDGGTNSSDARFFYDTIYGVEDDFMNRESAVITDIGYEALGPLGTQYGTAPDAGNPNLFRIDAAPLLTANGYDGPLGDPFPMPGQTGNYVNFKLGYIGSQLAAGYLYELIFLSAGASQENRQKIEGYLAHKWGIANKLPGGHPYKLKSPRD